MIKYGCKKSEKAGTTTMNQKILAILATGTLLATTVASVGCASKKAQLVATTPLTSFSTTAAETEPVSVTPDESVVINPVNHTEPEVTASEKFETEDLVLITSQTTEQTAKKASKKTTRKATKKTAKKTVRKTKKKTTKKSAKKTNTKVTYGHSSYYYQNMCVEIDIKKDNTAEVSVVEIKHNDPVLQYEIFWKAKGTFNPKTNTISYKTCVKTITTKTNTGKNMRAQDTTGKGTVKINGNTLTWNDGHDYKNNNFKFVKGH